MLKKSILKLALFLILLIFSATVAENFVMLPVSAANLAASPANAASTSGLQSQINADNDQISALNQEIAQYQTQLNEIGADKKTLQAAITTLDLQRGQVEAKVAATQDQINSTQLQIQETGTQIGVLKQNIITYQQGLAQNIQNINQQDNQPLIAQMFSSGSFSQFWQNYDQSLQTQDAVQKQAQELQAQEASLADAQSAMQQKQDALSAENQTLASQQQSLSATVSSKNRLLVETNSQESSYQKLLAQAQAQLQSFSNFTKSAGGDQLVSGQTACDSWGCYYNQRDAAWGNDSLDGTSYTLASDGCLITAMAMVLTHYGYRNVTPATINSNATNFAAYYPAYLLNTITADGITATRETAAIDATLAAGDPVIVGLNADGGSHYVVLVSGQKGDYIMRDPYITGGDDISFTSHYTLKEISSITKVVINT